MKNVVLLFSTVLVSTVVLAGGGLFGGKTKATNPNGVKSIAVELCGVGNCPKLRLKEGACVGDNVYKEFGVCLCDLGYVAKDGNCEPCPTGYYSDGQNECTLCGPGTHSVAGKAECVACDEGTFAPGGTDKCYACPNHADCSNESFACQEGFKNIGSTWENLSCVCEDGTALNDTQTGCVSCASLNRQDGTNGECGDCVGEYHDIEGRCILCSGDTPYWNGSQCVQCMTNLHCKPDCEEECSEGICEERRNFGLIPSCNGMGGSDYTIRVNAYCDTELNEYHNYACTSCNALHREKDAHISSKCGDCLSGYYENDKGKCISNMCALGSPVGKGGFIKTMMTEEGEVSCFCNQAIENYDESIQDCVVPCEKNSDCGNDCQKICADGICAVFPSMPVPACTYTEKEKAYCDTTTNTKYSRVCFNSCEEAHRVPKQKPSISQKCGDCVSGYYENDEGKCIANTCDDSWTITESIPECAEGKETTCTTPTTTYYKCSECNTGYHLEGDECVANTCDDSWTITESIPECAEGKETTCTTPTTTYYKCSECANGQVKCGIGDTAVCCAKGYTCSADGTTLGECYKPEGCATNVDCPNPGEFCLLTTGVRLVINGCDVSTIGTCKQVSDYMGGVVSTVEENPTAFTGWTYSNTMMSWYSANNWCQAQNLSLVTLDEVNSAVQTYTGVIPTDKTRANTLRKMFGAAVANYIWTSTPLRDTSCYARLVAYDGYEGNAGRNNYNGHAVCRE